VIVNPPEDLQITKYMDVGKLASMVYEGGVFFSSPDHLGDPHEGVLGDADRNEATAAALAEYPGVPREQAFARWVNERWATRLRAVTVSCWYVGGVESSAMWHCYGNSIAVESTVGSVLASLETKRVTALELQYQAYPARPATELNPISVLSYKRPPFANEHEVRFFYELDDQEADALPGSGRGWLIPDVEATRPGIVDRDSGPRSLFLLEAGHSEPKARRLPTEIFSSVQSSCLRPPNRSPARPRSRRHRTSLSCFTGRRDRDRPSS